jgi:hypothetical protein
MRGENTMKAWLERYIASETMATALFVWLCSLAVIGLVVTPVFGPRIAALTALGLLVAILIGCWAICIIRLPGQKR